MTTNTGHNVKPPRDQLPGGSTPSADTTKGVDKMNHSVQIDQALDLAHQYWLDCDDKRAGQYWDIATKLGWVPTWPKPGSPYDLATQLQNLLRDPAAPRGRPEPSKASRNTSGNNGSSWDTL